MTRIISALALCALAASPARAAPATYALQPDESTLYVQVFRDETALGSDLAHDHVVAATGWRGQVVIDPDDLASCTVEVTVPVAGLRPDQEEMRRLVGYAVMLTEAQQKQVTEHLQDKGQLNLADHAEITLSGRNCSGSLDALEIQASLNIRGKTKHFPMSAQVAIEGGALAVKARFNASHSEFGFEPYTAMLGALRNRADITFVVDVKGAAE